MLHLISLYHNLIALLAIAFIALLLANNPKIFRKWRHPLSTVNITGRTAIQQRVWFHKLFKIVLLPKQAILHPSNLPASQNQCLWSCIKKKYLSKGALRGRRTLQWHRGLGAVCVTSGTCAELLRGCFRGWYTSLSWNIQCYFSVSVETRRGV